MYGGVNNPTARPDGFNCLSVGEIESPEGWIFGSSNQRMTKQAYRIRPSQRSELIDTTLHCFHFRLPLTTVRCFLGNKVGMAENISYLYFVIAGREQCMYMMVRRSPETREPFSTPLRIRDFSLLAAPTRQPADLLQPLDSQHLESRP
jgi:hypothetical protein